MDAGEDFVETIADDAVDLFASEGKFFATFFDDDFLVVILEGAGDEAAFDVLGDVGVDLEKEG